MTKDSQTTLFLMVICMWATVAVPASAQSSKNQFSGAYAGIAGGAVDHHFVAVEDVAGAGERRFNVTKWGAGGEVFGGYDLALSRDVLVGAEAQFEFGGRTAVAVEPDYVFGFKPRYGFSVSGRIGYSLTPGVLAYAGAGYGEHHYRTIAQGNVSSAALDSLDSARSFILRGGVQGRLTSKLGIRFEYEHLDGSRNQFMLGLPIRF